MPDISGSALLTDARTWVEGAAAFAGMVIWTIWRKATQAGDEDRHKPSPASIGGTGVALLADSNPIREVTAAVEGVCAEIKGLRADLRSAREKDDDRRQESERETATDLRRENERLNDRLATLQSGQVRSHDRQEEILEKLAKLLEEADEAQHARTRSRTRTTD